MKKLIFYFLILLLLVLNIQACVKKENSLTGTEQTKTANDNNSDRNVTSAESAPSKQVDVYIDDVISNLHTESGEDEGEKVYFEIVWTSEITDFKEFKHSEKEDLNSDGTIDTIEYSFNVSNKNPVQNVELKINDSTVNIQLENPSAKCYIVDINPNDKYKEIIVHEDGASDDPTSIYYYYNGKEIIEMGTLSSYYYIKRGSSDIVMLHKAEQFEPQITVAYTKLDGNHMFVYEKVDKSSFINKKYKVHVPEHPDYTTWPIFESFKDYYKSKGLVGEIQDGETVTVLDLDTEYRGYTFKVKLDTGEEGWMVDFFVGN